MKIIVQSNNPKHGLLNDDNKFLPGDRPCVALHTLFLANRIGKGDFRVLVGNLEDEATDTEFQKFLKETPDDTQFAIDAFEAAYSSEPSRRDADFEQKRKDRADLLAREEKAAREERERQQQEENDRLLDVAKKEKAEAEEQQRRRDAETTANEAAAKEAAEAKEAADKKAKEDADKKAQAEADAKKKK